MDEPERRVEVEGRRWLLEAFFKVEEVDHRYERFSGEMSDTIRRLNFERGDAVAILIVDVEADEVLLIEQFRWPAHEKGPGWLVEVVAGIVEPGDDPVDRVRQEVLEETGYRVGRVEHIASFYVSPGGSSERIFLYYAEVRASDRIAEGGGITEEGEDIRLVHLPRSEVAAALQEDRYADAKTIVALQWLEARSD